MKTKFIVTAWMILIILSFDACQPTPEKEIVVQKDTERLIEKAEEENGLKFADIEVPEKNYVMSAEGADGNLIINVNAEVTVPKGKLPMARVSIRGFSEDEVRAYFNYLFPEEKPYVQVNFGAKQMTKGQIEETILYYKKCITDGTIEDQTLMTEEEALEEITKLEAELETAPETVSEQEKQICDGTMVPYQWASHMDEKVLWADDVLMLDAASDNEMITVIATNESTKNAQSYILYGSKDSPFLGTAQKIDIDDPVIPAVADKYLKLSFEEAKAICDGFFAAGGTEDMRPGRVRIISDGGLDENGEMLPADHFYYEFDYVREIDGVNVLAIGDCHTGGNTSVEVPWIYETARLCVNNDGIFYLFWMTPTETGDIITENASIKSFKEIQDVFSTMILIEYEPQVKMYDPHEIDSIKMNVDINEIELGLVRIRTQNADKREGIYTPAWVFSGRKTKDYYYVGGQVYHDESVQDEILLVINAVDGSIIDLEKGY